MRRVPLRRSCDFSAITGCRIASRPSSLNSPWKITIDMLGFRNRYFSERNGRPEGWKNPEWHWRVKKSIKNKFEIIIYFLKIISQTTIFLLTRYYNDLLMKPDYFLKLSITKISTSNTWNKNLSGMQIAKKILTKKFLISNFEKKNIKKQFHRWKKN